MGKYCSKGSFAENYLYSNATLDKNCGLWRLNLNKIPNQLKKTS